MTKEVIRYKRKMVHKELVLKFYPTQDLLDSKNFTNIKKVRCIALNDQGLICMVSNDGMHNWMIPGGTVEKNENPILALKRELIEEADIEIKKYQLIGFLEMLFINTDSNNRYHRTEMLFVGKISKVLEQTNDPSMGYTLRRDFFDIRDMAFKYMRWGKISKFIVEYLSRLKF